MYCAKRTAILAVPFALLIACAPLPDKTTDERARWESRQGFLETYRERGTAQNPADAAVQRSAPLPARTRLRRPAPVRTEPEKIVGGEPVSVHFNRVPLRLVAAVLANLTGNSIVVAEALANETVSLRVTDTPWRNLLSLLAHARPAPWSLRDEDGLVSLGEHRATPSAADEAAEQGVDLLRFLHTAPADVKEMATPLFAGAASKPVMSVDQHTGALMVKGRAHDIDLIAALAREIDRPTRQVLIETFIVEASEGVERNLGVRLGIKRADSGGIIRVAGTIGDAQSAVNLPVTAAAAGLGFVFDRERLRLELTALEEEGKTRIISNPRVFTLNGREAVIFQGDEVPYTSVSENGTQTEFKEAGVRLAVTPMIVGAGQLILDVEVSKDTVDTRVQNPPITRRQIKTRLLVADGATVIIGGIYFDTRVKAETRVPVLGRLPVLGHLFRRTQNTRDFRELLVFIAPKIVGVSP